MVCMQTAAVVPTPGTRDEISSRRRAASRRQGTRHGLLPNRTEPNRTEQTLNTGKDLQKGNPKQGESVDERSKGDGQSTVCLK